MIARASRALAGAALVAATLAMAPAASAQSGFPSRPVRMLVPFAPGGTTDIMARMVAQQMAQAWGQPTLVDNRPGANGIIASEMTARAAPDGYTLLYVAIGHAINSLIYRKLPYDTLRDFTPVSLGATFTQLLLVHPGVPAGSAAELLALARSGRPLTYASGGLGSSQHLAGALFAHLARINIEHVPYKGGAPALADLMARNVDLMIIQPTSADMVKGGRVRALAVSSARRHPVFADLPTIAEAGVKGFQSEAWYGLVAPARLPAPVLRRVHEQAVAALTSKESRERLTAQGGEVVASSPEAFAAFIRDEIARYAPVVKAAGIVAE
ncbi:MAG: tripartite tricarboxylate transporter substrate binding protein [Pseudomonadota bacterium]|jgi:tripartite-type tricarboxylate transporter receptor subunit TctC